MRIAFPEKKQACFGQQASAIAVRTKAKECSSIMILLVGRRNRWIV
ncbi:MULTISPECIES: hypothetical protein [unclassified Bradyrhizobium]|nr:MULTISPECIES: hypothetical protein [unclassified Bradyrhizobium]